MKTLNPVQKGSTIIWLLIIIVLLVLGGVAALIWGKTFLLTEGLDTSQVNSYTQAINSANKLKNQVENTNQSDTNAINKLNQLKNSNLPGY